MPEVLGYVCSFLDSNISSSKSCTWIRPLSHKERSAFNEMGPGQGHSKEQDSKNITVMGNSCNAIWPAFHALFFHIYLHSGEHTYFCPRVHPSLPEIKWTQSRRFKSQGTAGAAVRLAQPSVMKQDQPNRSRASYWKESVVLNRDLAMGGNKRRKKKTSLFGVCHHPLYLSV